MSIQFSRNLIKGRIAEVVFEQMMQEEGKYAVIPFGYEHTMPMLSQYQHLAIVRRVIDNIKDAPDFALVSEDKAKIYLVEVKYQTTPDIEVLKKSAKKLLKRWEPSWLFVATPGGFYCSPCSGIEKENRINSLSTKWVVRERQEAYLKLLKEFER